MEPRGEPSRKSQRLTSFAGGETWVGRGGRRADVGSAGGAGKGGGELAGGISRDLPQLLTSFAGSVVRFSPRRPIGAETGSAGGAGGGTLKRVSSTHFPRPNWKNGVVTVRGVLVSEPVRRAAVLHHPQISIPGQSWFLTWPLASPLVSSCSGWSSPAAGTP